MQIVVACKRKPLLADSLDQVPYKGIIRCRKGRLGGMVSVWHTKNKNLILTDDQPHALDIHHKSLVPDEDC